MQHVGLVSEQVMQLRLFAQDEIHAIAGHVLPVVIWRKSLIFAVLAPVRPGPANIFINLNFF